MTGDSNTREATDLVEAETRELVGPEPTELVERRTESLTERRTEALIERRTDALVRQNWYECVVCGYRSGHGVHEQLCPRCGGSLKNIGVGQE